MNRIELNKINKKLKAKGLTIVPIKLFINNKGLAKIDIALAKGKKIHDKREDLKSKDAKREIDRNIKKQTNTKGAVYSPSTTPSAQPSA